MAEIRSSRGVALILVTFIIALATIIVVNLTYNTYMASRANLVAERSLQSEFILKSVVNFARVLIKMDTSTENSKQDAWAKFSSGQAVDPKIFGINEPGLKIEVEIDSEDAKIPLKILVSSATSGAAPTWRDILKRLFQSLGFDNDKEVQKSGQFKGRFFSSEELVANLIDYMDSDKTSYDVSGFAKGIESDLDETNPFRNSPIDRPDELANIPGFTQKRVRMLLPYVTTYGPSRKVNINLAPKIIIKALLDDMTDKEVNQIIGFREAKDGPFTDINHNDEIEKILGPSRKSAMNLIYDVGTKSNPYFQVLAKLDYNYSTFFMRAYVYRLSLGDLPYIFSVELF